MAKGIPSVIASGVSAANVAIDSGVVPVHLTEGVILVVLSASGASALLYTVTDDLGNVLATTTFGAAATQQVLALGDAEGAPAAVVWGAGGVPAMASAAFVGTLPGGRGARRPLSLRIQIPALGAGLTGAYAIVGESRG